MINGTLLVKTKLLSALTLVEYRKFLLIRDSHNSLSHLTESILHLKDRCRRSTCVYSIRLLQGNFYVLREEKTEGTIMLSH